MQRTIHYTLLFVKGFMQILERDFTLAVTFSHEDTVVRLFNQVHPQHFEDCRNISYEFLSNSQIYPRHCDCTFHVPMSNVNFDYGQIYML